MGTIDGDIKILLWHGFNSYDYGDAAAEIELIIVLNWFTPTAICFGVQKKLLGVVANSSKKHIVVIILSKSELHFLTTGRSCVLYFYCHSIIVIWDCIFYRSHFSSESGPTVVLRVSLLQEGIKLQLMQYSKEVPCFISVG